MSCGFGGGNCSFGEASFPIRINRNVKRNYSGSCGSYSSFISSGCGGPSPSPSRSNYGNSSCGSFSDHIPGYRTSSCGATCTGLKLNYGGDYTPRTPDPCFPPSRPSTPREEMVNISKDPCFPKFVRKDSKEGIEALKEQKGSSKTQIIKSIAKGRDGVCIGMSSNEDKFMCYLFKEQKISAIPVATMDLLMEKGASFFGLQHNKEANQILLKLSDARVMDVIEALKKEVGIPIKCTPSANTKTKVIFLDEMEDELERD